jgi:Domain of unknown function (DUF4112)
MEVSRERAHRAWRTADVVGRLSDNLLRIGPWGIGLDGVLAWVPGANTAYSVGAGALLFYEGVRAGASAATLIRMGLYLTANSALTEIPLVGWAADTLFRGHLMASRALKRDIERRFGPAEPEPPRREWARVVRAALSPRA